MAGKKKRAGRELADMLAAYGSCILPGPLADDYDLYCQLWLNLERIRLQTASTLARGLALADGGEIDRDWADAVALTPEEVDELCFQAKAKRMEAMVRAQYRR